MHTFKISTKNPYHLPGLEHWQTRLVWNQQLSQPIDKTMWWLSHLNYQNYNSVWQITNPTCENIQDVEDNKVVKHN